MTGTLKFADGIILSIGLDDAQLIDLGNKDYVDIPMRELPALERLSLGLESGLAQERINKLLEVEVIEQGTPAPDPRVRDKLIQLDNLLLNEYRPHLSERVLKAYELTLEVHAGRKRFHTGLGQCPTLPETSLRRALLVGDSQDVGVLDVLLIGDDDLLSVPLAALGHRVTVYDIDEYVLGLVEQAAQTYKLPIKALEHDLRDPIANDTKESFDVFLTDPMSNAECFELFISRAIPLLRPNGRGFSAVHAPTENTFRSLMGKMKLPIQAWHRRHNRYYSHYFRLHQYESDWVEVRKTQNTEPTLAADSYASPVNLYQEAYYQRSTIALTMLDNMDSTQFAKPMFLDMVLDGIVNETDVIEIHRTIEAQNDWSLLVSHTNKGHLTLHVDRKRNQILFSAHPVDLDLLNAARYFLIATFKHSGTVVKTIRNQKFWDLRIE